MRSKAWIIAAAALLAGCASGGRGGPLIDGCGGQAAVSTEAPRPACTIGPTLDPRFAVPEGDARAVADTLTGIGAMDSFSALGYPPGAVYEFWARDGEAIVIALVDGGSKRPLAMWRLWDPEETGLHPIPVPSPASTGTPAIAAGAALAAADAFLADQKIERPGDQPAATLRSRQGRQVWVVTFDARAQVELEVDANTGKVEAFVDRRTGFGFALPVLGFAEAAAAALMVTGPVAVADKTPDPRGAKPGPRSIQSADLWCRLDETGRQACTWDFWTGVPQANPGPEGDTRWFGEISVEVDALTGETKGLTR